MSHDQSADTVVVIIDGLSPDRSYEYRVLLHHEEITYGDVNTVRTSLTIPAGMSCSNRVARGYSWSCCAPITCNILSIL